jgi:hypothetical protein
MTAAHIYLIGLTVSWPAASAEFFAESALAFYLQFFLCLRRLLERRCGGVASSIIMEARRASRPIIDGSKVTRHDPRIH